ncbi:hypothetical protein RND81_09G093400 [Saponaria officinalis]|uniref:Uncharacterized protein n=1 Tax=Saponaria officinalis TaxID=3572 RepID=A0AAW1IJU7_SAPOF
MVLIMANEYIHRLGGALLNSHEFHSFSESIAYCKRMLEVIRGRDTPAVDRTDARGLIFPVSRDICSANFEPSMNPCDYGSVSQSLEYVRRKLEEIRGRDETVKVMSVTAAHKHSFHSEFFTKEVGTLSPFDGSMDTCPDLVQNHNITSAFCPKEPEIMCDNKGIVLEVGNDPDVPFGDVLSSGGLSESLGGNNDPSFDLKTEEGVFCDAFVKEEEEGNLLETERANNTHSLATLLLKTYLKLCPQHQTSLQVCICEFEPPLTNTNQGNPYKCCCTVPLSVLWWL